MKNGFKRSVLVVLLALCAIPSIASLSAWYTIHHEVEVTVAGTASPYWVDLLVAVDEAAILDADELALLLPAEYRVDPYLEAVNGVIDPDGYASARLYAAGSMRFATWENGVVDFQFTAARPADYRVVVIRADGSVLSSERVAPTKTLMEVGYADSGFTFIESDGHLIEIEMAGPYIDNFLSILLFAAAMIASIAVVLFVLRAFGYRSKRTSVTIGLFSAVVVGVTVLLLAANANAAYPLLGALTILFLALVMFGQMMLLSLSHPELRPSRALAFAFLANAILGLSVLYFQSNLLWFFAL